MHLLDLPIIIERGCPAPDLKKRSWWADAGHRWIANEGGHRCIQHVRILLVLQVRTIRVEPWQLCKDAICETLAKLPHVSSSGAGCAKLWDGEFDVICSDFQPFRFGPVFPGIGPNLARCCTCCCTSKAVPGARAVGVKVEGRMGVEDSER
jgi:hypothetical protein